MYFLKIVREKTDISNVLHYIKKHQQNMELKQELWHFIKLYL